MTGQGWARPGPAAAAGADEVLSVGGVRVPAVGVRRVPFAVAVIAVTAVGVGGEDVERAGAVGRLLVSLAVYEAGYHLMDVVEVPECAHPAGRRWGRLRWAAAVTDAQAVFTYALTGEQSDHVNVMAEQLRMLVLPVAWQRL